MNKKRGGGKLPTFLARKEPLSRKENIRQETEKAKMGLRER